MNKPQILVVDDDAVNRQLLSIFVKEFGGITIAASNGKEAVRQYRDHLPDMVLMDLIMPIMDGIEATYQIRAYEQELCLDAVPIIAVTAKVGDLSQSACKAAGINAIVDKPIKFDRIKQAIDSLPVTSQE